MSTDWDVWCVDCDKPVTDFCDANHEEKYMLQVIAAAPALAALGLADPSARVVLDDRGDYLTLKARPFAEHEGHRLKPKDEYGRWYDQCREHVRCSDCGRSDNCVLKEGHDGGHSRQAVAA